MADEKGKAKKRKPGNGLVKLLETYHIHINGIVQGVGFRPMVYNMAKQMKLNGCVSNASDGVHIFFNALEKDAYIFFNRIKQEAPFRSKIISSSINKIENEVFENFSIVIEDDNKITKQVLLSPDIAPCANCRNELYNQNNVRYRYPFITCTQCGPRYSIVKKLPYERQDTSMGEFIMCERCNDEYENINDKRFFSQTNSCINCGVELWIKDNNYLSIFNNSEKVLKKINECLNDKKILAIKGVGGYLLICDAGSFDTIELLRLRKKRSKKPFAVMYPDTKKVQQQFELSISEKNVLESAQVPVVLVAPRKDVQQKICFDLIAPCLSKIGVMLPSNALLNLISNDFGKPIIATSANVSGSPIFYNDSCNEDILFEVADYIVTNNNKIIVPQDDSVIQITKHSQQQIILRRSRGYAPSFLDYKPQKKICVLATGAFLKSTFTLSVNGNIFISQYLGSGESYESQQMYKDTLQHLLKLYHVKSAMILTDKHHGYFSHQYAIELLEEYQSDIKFIQHHEAHFAAVLGENNLLKSDEPVLGVIWDGTGLGDDGNIWGGEFFRYENNEMLRCCYFDYFPVIAGDKPAMEPRIAALCTTYNSKIDKDFLKKKFTDIEWNNYQLLLHKATLFSSSAGRIFDAVASMLNVCDKQSYEGEAAIYLQVLAEKYVDENGFVMDDSYFQKDENFSCVPTASLMQKIIKDVTDGKAKNYIAAKFHYSLACLIDMVAQHTGIKKICFSGGVFQNSLLVDWIQIAHSKKYQLFFHKNLSPNDENISFGQLVHFDNDIKTIKDDLKNKITRENLDVAEACILNF